MDTVSGDAFLLECARYIRYNEAKLGNVPGPSSAPAEAAAWYNPTTWLSPLGTPPGPPATARGRPAAPANGKGKGIAPSPQRRNRPVPLRVSAHHLFYVLLRCEGLGLPIGHLDVRIPAASRPASYFAFISSHAAGSGIRRKERDDTMSISSLQTTMSTLSAFGGVGNGSGSWWSSRKDDPISNIKYIYSAMTKIPALRIIPPPLRLISDFEDCPGEMSVPLEAFKNVQYLEFEDADPRSFLGWDRLSYQLRSLSMKRSGVEDVGDVIIDAVINDGKRRRGEPVKPRKRKVHAPQQVMDSSTDSNNGGAGAGDSSADASDDERPTLPSLSWHFLRHLGLSDNSLTFLHSRPMSCVADLTSLDISHNLLNAVPPCLHLLLNLTSLNVSNNLIESVLGIPAALPAIEALNLSHNRLESLCGLERLSTLVRIDLRHNEVLEAGEVGRLAILPDIAEVHAAQNPLYEDEPDARVLVLAEFAREGHDLDLLKLDDEVAGYFEKQRIRERVPNLDRLRQHRAGRRSEPSDAAAGPATAPPLPASSRAQPARHEATDNATDSAGGKLKVKNVRHRGGARHGARTESTRQAEQRRNRRVVDLHDSMHEAQASIESAEGTSAAKDKTSIPAVEATESDAIKDAARQGKLDEAMGAIALASHSNDEAAARREPSARAQIGRRGKTRVGSNGSSSAAPTDEAAQSIDQALAKAASSNAANAGEDLRRRIEALKGEVGDDWMRLLARGESVYVPSTSTRTDEEES